MIQNGFNVINCGVGIPSVCCFKILQEAFYFTYHLFMIVELLPFLQSCIGCFGDNAILLPYPGNSVCLRAFTYFGVSSFVNKSFSLFNIFAIDSIHFRELYLLVMQAINFGFQK